MREILESSVFFGAAVSVGAYLIGAMLRKKFNSPILNPLLIAVLLTVAVLILTGVDYDSYYEGAKYISYFLTPATVCLSIALYEKLELLKENKLAVAVGIISGTLTNLICIFLMALLFAMSHEEYVSLLPKSVTTAIGMDISAELGGYVSITAAVIIVTGILGNVIAEAVFKLFKINDPIAKGVALGTASHAIGTAKAMEIGETEGAMASVSIVATGLVTVVGASFFALFI